MTDREQTFIREVGILLRHFFAAQSEITSQEAYETCTTEALIDFHFKVKQLEAELGIEWSKKQMPVN
jgi:hypothetical protein